MNQLMNALISWLLVNQSKYQTFSDLEIITRPHAKPVKQPKSAFYS